jgi:hypothetical protein
MRRLERAILLAGVAASAAGCMTTRFTQRDGCWVRETHKTLHGTQEEIGPCMRPQPRWAEDRPTRLVQECVAQADFRWEVRALAAWDRHEPLPPQDSQETVIKTCMDLAAAGFLAESEKLQQRLGAVQERLAEISGDRDAFRSEAKQGTDHLRASTDKLVAYLGEAAKRPAPVATATATATSDGTATSDTGLQADNAASGTVPAGAAGAPVVSAGAAPATAPPNAKRDPTPASGDGSAEQAKRLAAKAARKRALARATRAGCDVPVAARAADPTPVASPPAPVASPPAQAAAPDAAPAAPAGSH